MMKYLSILLLAWSVSCIAAPVLIITHSYNRPDFIEIQYKTFKKFLQDDYEYVVFNDARDPKICHNIENTCHSLRIKCVRIPQEIHTKPYLPRLPDDPLHRPNIRHVNAVQYSMDTLGFNHDGIVTIIDSDMFLVRPFSIAQYMQKHDIAGVIAGRENGTPYIWAIMCFMHMDRLPNKKSLNFNCGVADGKSVDAGGWTYYYLKNNPQVRVNEISVLWSSQLFCAHRITGLPADNSTPKEVQVQTLKKLGFGEREILFIQEKPDTFEFFLDNHFFHYRAGSNYDNQSQNYHNHKTKLFNEFIRDILK